MKDRIKAIIEYKTGGRIRAFGALLGWSPQYLSKLLRGENIGITPVRAILEAMPEINARWLIVGEGSMIVEERISSMLIDAIANAGTLISLYKYVGVMTPKELRRLERDVSSGRAPSFTKSDIERWEMLQQASIIRH